MSVTQVKCQLGENEIIIETGKLAKQAGGSVTVRSGDTMILVTATSSSEPKEGIDFLPLTVEYLEKTAAAGKIPGGFFKREGRPGEQAILTSRCIDRPIRPLFPENYHFDTQVITTVLSATPEHLPDTLAIVGASAALTISDIPLQKPIAGCRVGRINNEFVLNPSLTQMEKSDMELVVAATEDAVVMVEGGCDELSEEVLLEAIQYAHESLKPVIEVQKELQKLVGKEKREVPVVEVNEEISKAVAAVEGSVKDALAITVKLDRYAKLKEIKAELEAKLITEESSPNDKKQLGKDFEALKSKLMRTSILKDKKRIDGRSHTEIRPIDCEVGLLPRPHGSGLFTRGETQALVTTTLGTGDDEQILDNLLESSRKRFMLTYNFPPFCVGEVRPLRSAGRREIGHGHLAERALLAMMPSQDEFPYTVRIVSEVLESNGSSSMATVCGGSLSLMDAGVPLRAPVAGIAMGLIKEESDVAILSDILGDEDHLGDMDFKVTGTKKGVTALQMDIKISGVTKEILQSALSQAKEGRYHILGKMAEAIETPREEMSAYAPRIETLKIPQDKIGGLIGPGGKTIKGIIEETGVKIDIDDDGSVNIFGTNKEGIDKAKELINSHTEEVEVGKVYSGTVKRIVDFGAFVEILPKTEGLVHISQISQERIAKVSDVLKEGEEVTVKVMEINRGKIRLSMKAVA